MPPPSRILIVGAGFSGAVIAREIADAIRCVSIDVVDKRLHLAGNCFTRKDESSGIELHEYGPHIFNTDLEHVWSYVNRFGAFRAFSNRVKAHTVRGVFSLPINLHTINQFFGKTFSPNEAQRFIASLADKGITHASNFEERALQLVGSELYECFFKGYTEKQWGCSPTELPASILARLPIRFNYRDDYYSTKYQAIPVNGYTSIVENILSHKNINVFLGSPYRSGMELNYDHMFYSGPIDEYFNHVEGRLGYRTVTFERVDGEGDIQGNAVVNYTDVNVPYTRIHEHKHFTPWNTFDKSVAFREYSKATGVHDIPFYPLRLKRDIQTLNAYQDLARNLGKVTFIGRLGTYRYLDMDDVIDEALQTAHAYLERL